MPKAKKKTKKQQEAERVVAAERIARSVAKWNKLRPYKAKWAKKKQILASKIPVRVAFAIPSHQKEVIPPYSVVFDLGPKEMAHLAQQAGKFRHQLTLSSEAMRRKEQADWQQILSPQPGFWDLESPWYRALHGLLVVDTGGSGDCAWRALSFAIYGDPNFAYVVYHRFIAYVNLHWTDNFMALVTDAESHPTPTYQQYLSGIHGRTFNAPIDYFSYLASTDIDIQRARMDKIKVLRREPNMLVRGLKTPEYQLVAECYDIKITTILYDPQTQDEILIFTYCPYHFASEWGSWSREYEKTPAPEIFVIEMPGHLTGIDLLENWKLPTDGKYQKGVTCWNAERVITRPKQRLTGSSYPFYFRTKKSNIGLANWRGEKCTPLYRRKDEKIGEGLLRTFSLHG